MENVLSHIERINNFEPSDSMNNSPKSLASYMNQAAGQMMADQSNHYESLNNSLGLSGNNGLASPKRIYNERWAHKLQGVHNNAPYGTVNPASGLGTSSDLGSHNQGRTPPPYMFFGFLDDIYRENFLFRNAVDIPADDLCREPRRFITTKLNSISEEDLEIRAEAEALYEVQKNINLAVKWARLYGGSAIVLGIDGQYDLMQPLAYEDIKKGSLRTMNVVFKDQIVPTGILDTNPASPYYGQVAMYAITTWQASSFTQWSSLDGWVTELQRFNENIAGVTTPQEASELDRELSNKQKRESFQQFSPYGSGNVFVHRSRIIIFNGYSLPLYSKFRTLYWNDSILVPAWNVLDLAEQNWQSAAQLLQKANVDVIYSENFLQTLKKNNGDIDQMSRGIRRHASNYNFMFLDKSLQQLERKQINNLAGVKDIIDVYLRLVAMSFRIPVAKIGCGLNIKGSSATDEELVLYYDFIRQIQSGIQGELRHLDHIIEMSVFGKLMNIRYEWPEPYSLSPAQKASIDLQKAQENLIHLNAGVIGIDDVRRQLVESGKFDKITAKEILPKIMGEIEKDLQLSSLASQLKMDPNVAKGGSATKLSGSSKNLTKAAIPDHGDRFKTSVQTKPSISSGASSPIKNRNNG